MIQRTSFIVCIGILACEGRESLDSSANQEPGSKPSSKAATRASIQDPVSLHAGFDALLKKHVRQERVDYLRLREDDLPELEAYLDSLAKQNLAEFSESAKLAFYINLYNATMIHEVVLRLRAGFGGADNDFAMFKEPFVRQADKRVSLNDLENEIIRKQFDEPRIHVALVCGARSCPPLIKTAYTADNLEALLQKNMQRFVNDSFRNKISSERASLSKIFEWYADDFGGKDQLLAYIGAFTDVNVSKARVDFLEYQWDLNIAPPASGTWVQVLEAEDGLQEGDLVEVLRKEGETLFLRRPFGKGEARLAVGQVKSLANS
ncbi:MAG: DUF547 domain-containing protein [Planctomycetota bacterium]|jgi:hypothetical protein